MIAPGALRRLLDTMIPGRANRWPAASDVVDLAELGQALERQVAPAALAAFAAAGREASDAEALALVAAAHPDDARRLTEIVYAAYYATPAVQSVVRELAEAGPREPAADFDETLLDQVKALRPGQRRL